MWVVIVAKWRVKYYIPWSTNGAIYVDIAALILLTFCVADGRSLKFNNLVLQKAGNVTHCGPKLLRVWDTCMCAHLICGHTHTYTHAHIDNKYQNTMQAHVINFWEQVMISTLLHLFSIEYPFISLHLYEVGLDHFYLKLAVITYFLIIYRQ